METDMMSTGRIIDKFPKAKYGWSGSETFDSRSNKTISTILKKCVFSRSPTRNLQTSGKNTKKV
jgi:hypothetical protein